MVFFLLNDNFADWDENVFFHFKLFFALKTLPEVFNLKRNFCSFLIIRELIIFSSAFLYLCNGEENLLSQSGKSLTFIVCFSY